MARLRFEADLGKAVTGVGFVQESGPECVEIKRDLIAHIDAAVEDGVLIATSSSGILVSEVQTAAHFIPNAYWSDTRSTRPT